MGWYSLLPPYLTVVETWIIRIAICCAIVNISPWLLAILADLVLYIFRQIWYWIPIWGGRAQGKSRPRAPSLDIARKRAQSLVGLMANSDQENVHADDVRRRQRRHTSVDCLDHGTAGEDSATTSTAAGAGCSS